MNLSLLKTFGPSSTFARGHSLIHAECPIEQTLRSDDPTVQDKLMREPWARQSRPEGTLYVADYNGLRLLGRSEAALDAAVEPLRRRFGVRIIVDAPSVRYVFGYISIGEDDAPNPVNGNGEGPVFHNGTAIVPENRGIASFYVDQEWNGTEYLSDGTADLNPNFSKISSKAQFFGAQNGR